MFSTDGNPLRAKVGVKMKEWTSKDRYSGSQGSAGYSMKRAKLVTVGAGDTVTSIAAAQGTTAQAICDANNISDPLNIQVGVTLAVFF
jgi:LysM repeat protein